MSNFAAETTAEKKTKTKKGRKLKEKILQLIAAFVALLHTQASDTDQIAQLKGQLANLNLQLKNSVQFSDDEIGQINSAVNQIAAAAPPTAEDVEPVAAVAPAPNQSASDIPSPAVSVPGDVATAAAASPEPATS